MEISAMKRFLLTLGLWLGLTSSALAQNPTCPTRPLGDTSNACASTAFVQNQFATPSLPLPNTQIYVGQVTGFAGAVAMSNDCTIVASGAITCTKLNGNPIGTSGVAIPLLSTNNIWGGDQYFKSGRPWCDVRANGAVGDGSTDDTTAVQGCINIVQALGGGAGIVYFPQSSAAYCLKGGVTVTSATTLEGASDQGSVLSACKTDITPVTLNGGNAQIKNLFIQGKGVNNDTSTFGATQSALVIGTNCVTCRLDHVYVWGGLHAIQSSSGEVVMIDVNASIAFGDSLTKLNGGAWMLRNKFDQSWLNGQPSVGTTFSAWTNAHAYASGEVVTLTCAASGVTCPTGVTAFYLQAMNAGTSAGTAPVLKNYGIAMVDNTVTWQLIAPTTYPALNMDTNAVEVQVFQSDFSGPFSPGISMSNSLAGTAPSSIILTDNVIGGNISGTIAALSGNNLTMKGNRIGGCVQSGCADVNFATAWGGDSIVVGNTFLGGQFGIVLNIGKNYDISANNIFGMTTSAITVAANISHFNIIGNNLGSSTQYGTNSTTITVNAGTSDFYNITGNNLNGATTAAISDGGTGNNKNVSGNESRIGLSTVTNTLGGAVNLNNTANFFDGPSVAQGTVGTWFASGTVTIAGNVGDNIICKLWDATTIIASASYVQASGAATRNSMSLSGSLTSPAANIRISCRDVTSTSGTIAQSDGLNNTASVLTALRTN